MNTLLIRFFSINLSESTSSFDSQALILPFITSNYKTDINMSCVLLSLFSAGNNCSFKNFQKPPTMNEYHTYFVEDNKTNMYRKSRKSNMWKINVSHHSQIPNINQT